MPTTTERRKTPRYRVPEGSFVISQTNPYERCSLVDIGPSGLAYHHEMDSEAANPSDQLAIMTPDGEIVISGIPCRIVSDLCIPGGSALPEAEQTRRSVCFENLTLLQMEQIDRFIQTHTTQMLH